MRAKKSCSHFLERERERESRATFFGRVISWKTENRISLFLSFFFSLIKICEQDFKKRKCEQERKRKEGRQKSCSLFFMKWCDQKCSPWALPQLKSEKADLFFGSGELMTVESASHRFIVAFCFAKAKKKPSGEELFILPIITGWQLNLRTLFFR